MQRATQLPSLSSMPLYVDMDGTLTPSDTLYESVMLFVRQSPLNLLRLLAWLALGKAGFKRRLADAVRPDPARLPYREDFLQYLRTEHARGRTLVLASAADARIVREVAQHVCTASPPWCLMKTLPSSSRLACPMYWMSTI